MGQVILSDYDPEWPKAFTLLRNRVADELGSLAIQIEHVGSTSVPNLAAKPIIDMTVVAHPGDMTDAIAGLEKIGYRHRGNLGIEGREAFHSPEGLPKHHLYLCPVGSLGLFNHLQFRDHLRSHPDCAEEYGRLKRNLARLYPNDLEAYIEAKTEFIVKILSFSKLSPEDLASIISSNKKKETDQSPGFGHGRESDSC